MIARLVAAHPELRAEAEQIAESVLCEAFFEDVAGEVEDAVRQLGLEDLSGRAGRHSWGYTEPTDAAFELLEEVVQPFLEDMENKMGLGLPSAALEVCKGLVLGLYRCRDKEGDDLLAWAPDFPAEAAGNAIVTWLRGASGQPRGKRASHERQAFPQDFVDEFVPEWRSLVASALKEADRQGAGGGCYG
ncbi:MAG: hypothetical protein HY238_27685 [Acidobacteria bacterium]|nr:hypothetical protein [Acidobacteriota bacterium]